ncbi:MAG: hypothetical protein WCO52_05585 [bacterium]
MSYRFQGQHNSEEVVLFSHQHPLVLLRPFMVAGSLLLLPLAAFVFITSNSFLSALFLLCLVLAVVRGVLAWHAWNNSLVLLTNERVIFLSQKGPFNRELVECSLQAVLQVSHEVKGLFNTLFGFGDITIRTPGTGEPFLIRSVPDPYTLQQEILRVATGE